MSDTRVTLHFTMSGGSEQDVDFVIPDPMSVSADPDNAIEVKADGLFVPTVKTLASEFTEDAWWYVDYQGYLHQGGTAGTTDGEDVITFPQAFAAAPFDYGIVDHSWSADGVDGVGVSPDELTATEMGIYSYSLPEDGPSTTSLRWHATGLAPAELLDTIGGIGIQGPQGPAAVITSEDGSITVVQNAQTGETDLSVPAGGGGGVTSITSEDESVTVVVDDETGAVDLSVPASGGGGVTNIVSSDQTISVGTQSTNPGVRDLSLSLRESALMAVVTLPEKVVNQSTANIISLWDLSSPLAVAFENSEYLYITGFIKIFAGTEADETKDWVSTTVSISYKNQSGGQFLSAQGYPGNIPVSLAGTVGTPGNIVNTKTGTNIYREVGLQSPQIQVQTKLNAATSFTVPIELTISGQIQIWATDYNQVAITATAV